MSGSAQERARDYLARRGWPGAQLQALKGDASARSYFRAGLAHRTEVLLVESEPGAQRLAAFLSMARFLDEQGFAPPRVLDEAADLGILALEDLGEVSLRRALEQAAPPRGARRLFGAALDLLVRLQREGTAALAPGISAYAVRFDAAVFGRELTQFRERYLRDLLAIPHEGPDLIESLDWLARRLAAAPGVLTHRDYHMDNLHVTEGRLRLIDFQDARWGPAAYDPASLLNDRDVHRFLAPGEAEPLLERFVEARGLDPAAFQDEYRLAVVQRSLKAVGTFADQSLRRGRDEYLAYIVPSLRRARAAARPLPELEPLEALLSRVLERAARG